MASGTLRLPRRRDADEADPPGWAAHGAHIATRLATTARQGPRSVFEGQFGIYHAFLGVEPGEIDIAGQLADLGAAGRRRGSRTSPSRSATSSHGAVGAAVDAVAGRTFAPDEIEEVVVTVPGGVGLARARAGRTRSRRRGRSTRAKFSLQYSVASMLVRGHVGVRTYTDEAITDPHVLALAAKVSLRDRASTPTYPAGVPGRRPDRRCAVGRDARGASFPYQKGGTREPVVGRRRAREVPRERRARALRRRPPSARGGDPRTRGAGRPDRSARAAHAAGGRSRMTARSR